MTSKLEITGMVLVLASVGWEVFGEKAMSGVTTDAYFTQLDYKLNQFFEYVILSKTPTSYVNPTEAKSVFRSFDFIGKDPFKIKYFVRIRFLLFSAGSILLILSKITD